MKQLIYSFLILLLPLSIMAQTSSTSPYSIFGLGETNNLNFNHLRHMGNLGASFSDPYHINLTNPASLASLRATAFDVSVFTEYSQLSEGDVSNTSFGGNLEYLSLAFPTKNPYTELFENKTSDFGHGMAISLIPHSLVGYNVASIDSLADIGNVSSEYRGSGGTYKFIVSNGVKYKDFSAGLNLGYLFGRIRYSKDIGFLDLPNSYSVNHETNYSVRGFVWNMGLMYTHQLNAKQVAEKKGVEPKKLTLGITYGSNTSFNTKSNEINLNAERLTSTLTILDTLSIAEGIEGKGTLPGEFNIGATFYNGTKFVFGVNYMNSFWSSYKNDADPESQLSDSNMLTFGGYYRPNYKSIDKYYKRVYYRFGFYTGSTPITVDNQRINDYGITLGFGMPFVYQKKISHANIGFTFGKKGSGSAIEERFARLSFGFTFNDDEWFIKRKYN